MGLGHALILSASTKHPSPHCYEMCSEGRREGSTGRSRVRKLEDSYFKDWSAGTELGLEGFKQLMRVELRR
jgi:hypothetical protein